MEGAHGRDNALRFPGGCGDYQEGTGSSAAGWIKTHKSLGIETEGHSTIEADGSRADGG